MRRAHRLVAVGFLTFVVMSCYTSTRGPFVRTERVPGFERTVGSKLVLVADTRPTSGVPILRLRVARAVENEFEVDSVFQSVIVRSPAKDVFAGIFWIGAGTAAVMKGRVMRSGDSLTSTGDLLVTGGVVAAVTGLLYWAHARGDEASKPEPNKMVRDGRHSERVLATGQGVPSQSVELSVANVSRRYSTDVTGRIMVDFAKDFGFEFAENTRQLSVAARIPGTDAELQTVVDTKDFMLPCVRTVGRGQIHREADAGSLAIAEFLPERTLVIRDSSANWYQVESQGDMGWIARPSTRRCFVARRPE
jgi:hypothetical protein